MRCSNCGAHNPDEADWCGQCFVSLREPEPEPSPEPEPADDPASEPAVAAPTVADTDGETRIIERGDVAYRHTPEGLDWRCGLCESWNPLEVTVCTTCGRSFVDTVRPAEDVEVAPALGENAAVLTSAIVPGLGHILLGHRATGLARAVMYVLFLLGGWLLLREATLNQQPILPALPLLLGALVLWVGSVYDALLLVRGSDQELLRPRVFFWMVVVVLGLLMLTFAASALSVTGRATGNG